MPAVQRIMTCQASSAITHHTALTGASKRGLTLLHQLDSGTAPSRENAYSVLQQQTQQTISWLPTCSAYKGIMLLCVSSQPACDILAAPPALPQYALQLISTALDPRKVFPLRPCLVSRLALPLLLQCCTAAMLQCATIYIRRLLSRAFTAAP
jgi:hypothetical protein